MNGWLIAGAVLAALTLLLSCSVVVSVRITDAVRIRVGMLGVRFDVLSPERDARKAAREEKEKRRKKPRRANKKKKRASGKKKDASARKKQQEKEEDRFLDTVQLILRLIRSVFSPSLYVLRHTRLTGVSIEMAVGGESADKTALACAGIGIALNNALALLKSQITVRVKRLSIRPDFTSGRITQNTRFRVKLRLGVIIVGVAGMLIHIIRDFFLREREQEPDHTKESESKEGVDHE